MPNRATSIFTSFYVAQFLFLGVQLPYFSGWLDSEGFTPQQIGLLTGGALILRLLFGPVVAYWAEFQTDRRRPIVLMTALLAGSSLCLIIDTPLLVTAIVATAMLWAFGCLVPLTDTAVLTADKAGQVNFGKARGFGSLAFILANLAGGVIITAHGDRAGIYWMAIAASFAVAIAMVFPSTRSGSDRHRLDSKSMRKDALRLFRSKTFILMLIATGATQGAHATYYYFSELHWSEQGYGSDLIGVLWALGVGAEILVLYAGRRFIAKFGPGRLIAIGALAALIRWPLTGLSPPLYVLVILQLLHAFTFATTYLGSVEFISRAIPEKLANTGMSLVSTLGIGALTGLGAMIAGPVFSKNDPFNAYLVMTGMASIGFVASLELMRRWDGGLIKSADAEKPKPE